MKSWEISKPHFIILLVLCLSFLIIVPDELAWAGQPNQTVPTALPTETATATTTSTSTSTVTSTSTSTATATFIPTNTATSIPIELPPEIIEDSEAPQTSSPNLRTYIGVGIIIFLVAGVGVGAFIWRLVKK